MSQATATPAERTSTGTRPTVRVRPAVDLIEEERSFLLLVEMPGVDASGVEVSLEKNVVSIQGTAPPTVEEGYSAVNGELPVRVYERSFRISGETDSAGIDAEMKNGLLRLRLPKSQQALRTSVPVKSS